MAWSPWTGPLAVEVVCLADDSKPATSWADRGGADNNDNGRRTAGHGHRLTLEADKGTWSLAARVRRIRGGIMLDLLVAGCRIGEAGTLGHGLTAHGAGRLVH